MLQPCLYLIGSKPLSSIEAQDFSDGGPYKTIIEKYYKSLNMEDLATENKIDHRYLFSAEKRTVYSDNWCHLNTFGTELIVEDLIKILNKYFMICLINEIHCFTNLYMSSAIFFMICLREYLRQKLFLL